MNRSLPIILLIAGLAIIGYGLMKKDDGQAEIDLGRTEITLGEKDSTFNMYFIVGGIAATAGLLLLLRKNKS